MAKLSPFHAIIVLGKNNCPWTILSSCMTNPSEFLIELTSCALIHLNKDTFEGHMCQTVDNFVKLFFCFNILQDHSRV